MLVKWSLYHIWHISVPIKWRLLLPCQLERNKPYKVGGWMENSWNDIWHFKRCEYLCVVCGIVRRYVLSTSFELCKACRWIASKEMGDSVTSISGVKIPQLWFTQIHFWHTNQQIIKKTKWNLGTWSPPSGPTDRVPRCRTRSSTGCHWGPPSAGQVVKSRSWC